MFQVVVLPPPESMQDVERFRRLHDPAFHRLSAHVSLLPPFEAASPTLVERFDALDAAPIGVAFGPPRALGRALCLPLTRGGRALRTLQTELAAILLGPLGAPPPFPPSLRVGLFGSETELELARRSLATVPAPEPFVVSEVTLLLEDERGLWHAVRRTRLARRDD